LTEDWDPITAGQTWCVDLSKNFIGQPALKRVAEEGPKRQIVGLEVSGKRIARQGYAILKDGRQIGVVTSGVQAPSLEKNIAMSMLDAAHVSPGTRVEIDLRGTMTEAKVIPLPFYKRPAKKG
jgi:aminomethyltransferase